MVYGLPRRRLLTAVFAFTFAGALATACEDNAITRQLDREKPGVTPDEIVDRKQGKEPDPHAKPKPAH